MKTVRDICQYIGNVIDERPVCVETGCTYYVAPEALVHTTTNNIWNYVVEPNSGDLYSLDISEEHINIAINLLKPSCTNNLSSFRFMLGDSVDSLKKLNEYLSNFGDEYEIGLLCLDSKEFDEDHMVNEYNAIKDMLAEKHFVLVDDIHNPNSVKYKKMVPILKDLGYSYIEVPTPTGMFVASKGYKLP